MMTRILWVNPINTPDYDQAIGEFIDSIRAPGTAVEVVSFNAEAPINNLEYRSFEALVTADLLKTGRYASEQGFDAMIIGCFYDPALEHVREISGQTVVVAPCQASIQLAANLANNFSVIIGQEKWRAQMHERISFYGYGSRLASMQSIDIAVENLQKDCAYTTEKIIEAGRRAVEEDKAEALILGCTCTFGMYRQVQEELGVPVIDPIIAAFKAAEFIGNARRHFDWTPSRAWSSAAPSEEMFRTFNLFDNVADVVGNRFLLQEVGNASL